MKIKTVGLLTELKDFMLTLNKVASSVWTTMVGTIVATYAPARQVAKGDEIDYFAFGGSSILILVDRDKITIDADLLGNTRKVIETAVLMGKPFATRDSGPTHICGLCGKVVVIL